MPLPILALPQKSPWVQSCSYGSYDATCHVWFFRLLRPDVVLTMDANDVSVSQIAYVVVGEPAPTEEDVLDVWKMVINNMTEE